MLGLSPYVFFSPKGFLSPPGLSLLYGRSPYGFLSDFSSRLSPKLLLLRFPEEENLLSGLSSDFLNPALKGLPDPPSENNFFFIGLLLSGLSELELLNFDPKPDEDLSDLEEFLDLSSRLFRLFLNGMTRFLNSSLRTSKVLKNAGLR